MSYSVYVKREDIVVCGWVGVERGEKGESHLVYNGSPYTTKQSLYYSRESLPTLERRKREELLL